MSRRFGLLQIGFKQDPDGFVFDTKPTGTVLELEVGENQFGRTDLLPKDGGISRKHFNLTVAVGGDGEEFTLVDTSRNGTLLGEEQIDGHTVVQLGDEIRCGPRHVYRLIEWQEEESELPNYVVEPSSC